MKAKPIILWTCDVPGWAYHARIKRLEKALPQYEFQIWYFGNPLPASLKSKILREADVIICQGVKSLRIIEQKRLDFSGIDRSEFSDLLDSRYDNIIARLDSMRVDIKGEYVDIFK